MHGKTLQTIQAFMKAGHILSKIAFAVSMVGAILCPVCLVSVGAGHDAVIAKFGDVTVYGLAALEDRYSLGTMYAGIAAAYIFCLGEVFMAWTAKRYFKFELAQGTPFTLEGASKMHRLGAAIFLISIGCVALAQISCAVISMNYGGADSLGVEGCTQVGLGLTFILVSLLCKLGAEQNAPEL